MRSEPASDSQLTAVIKLDQVILQNCITPTLNKMIRVDRDEHARRELGVNQAIIEPGSEEGDYLVRREGNPRSQLGQVRDHQRVKLNLARRG